MKYVVASEIHPNWNLSYGDVISYLINELRKSRRLEYNIEPKLLIGNLLDKSNLKISVPLKNVSVARSSRKLDGKIRVSYSLE